MEYKTVKVLNVLKFLQSLLYDHEETSAEKKLFVSFFGVLKKKESRIHGGLNAILAWKHETSKSEIVRQEENKG